MTEQYAVLIVDDEVQLCKLIARKLKKAAIHCHLAHNGKEALTLLKHHHVDVVILDYLLPDMTGLEVLKEIKKNKERLPVIMLTAYGNVESAVKAMKLGAADYLNKPIELAELKDVVLKFCAERSKNIQHGKSDTRNVFKFKSQKMKSIMALLEQVKETDVSILILGESGVGKTALAKWIHEHSHRRNGPFLSINCAAIPESLLESELFGYKKGAFTGATSSKAGKFTAAGGGTIFLDEIGEISAKMQAKLLHVLEEKRVMQLGSNDYQEVDVRIITATNKNIREMVKAGAFREDLYYRLNLIEVNVPPLRERKEDIPLLIDHYMSYLNAKYNKHISIDAQCLTILSDYHWPGNVRELLNILERVHILKRKGTIHPEDLVQASLYFEEKRHNFPSGTDQSFNFLSGPLPKVLEEVEAKMIKQALEETNGNQTKAAERLGISRHALIYKIKKMGLKS